MAPGGLVAKHEAQIPALEGKVPVYFAAHRSDDISTALRLASVFKLKPVIDPARLIGIAEKYGSIEKGKVADLVLYDGDPFEHATHVTQTIMNGQSVFSRADYLKLPFERRILPLLSGGGGAGCCLGMW